jgi:Cd2+/Zn2+-exporting ATPase
MVDTHRPPKYVSPGRGIDCTCCTTTIENAQRRMPGISDVVGSVPTGTVTVTRDGTEVDDKIGKQIKDLGCQVIGREDVGIKRIRRDQGGRTSLSDYEAETRVHERSAATQSWWQTRKSIFTIGFGVALACALVFGKLIPAAEHWAFLITMLVGLIPIGRRATSAARVGTPFSIEMLMSIVAAGDSSRQNHSHLARGRLSIMRDYPCGQIGRPTGVPASTCPTLVVHP